jgi:hypothetical protein
MTSCGLLVAIVWNASVKRTLGTGLGVFQVLPRACLAARTVRPTKLSKVAFQVQAVSQDDHNAEHGAVDSTVQVPVTAKCLPNGSRRL